MLNAPLLNDRYRPTRLLAEGGSARVFRATDELLGRDVAVKVFHAGDAPQLAQVRSELATLAGLSHHGVVSVIDAGIDQSSPDDPRPFIVMELVRGETVRSRIDERTLSARDIGGIGFEVSEALEYVHSRGVVHRDITPANILLVDYGTESARPRARITDFGIATSDGGAAERTTVGTAAYLSPEQALGHPLTRASDIYSLGLVLLESFTARTEFPGTSVDDIAERLRRDAVVELDVPSRWRPLLASMTHRDPASRPSPADVIERLRLLLRRERG